MRKNPTLPSLSKQPVSVTQRQREKSNYQRKKMSGRQSSLNGLQNFKVIQKKVSIHDEQITKNQKIILALTQQFRSLKEKLSFQQECNTQNKNMINKLQENNKKIQQQTKQYRMLLQKKDKQYQDIKRKLQIYETQKSAVQFKEDIQNLQIKNQNDKKEIIRLKIQLQKLTQMNKELQNQQSKFKQERLYILTQKQCYDSQIGIAKQQITSLSQQICKIKEKISQKINQNMDMKKKVQFLTESIHQKQIQIKQILSQNTKISEENLSLVNQCQNFKKEMFKYNQKVFDLEITIKKLTEKQSQIRSVQKTQIENQKFKTDELYDLKNKCEKLIKINEVLQKQHQEQQKNMLKSAKRIQQLQYLIENMVFIKQKLNETTQKIRQSIRCEYCQKTLNKCVTIIPCGHSFCQQCKKGYDSECKKCKHRKEAVYRNELMDEIISAYKLIQNIKF